MKTNEYLKIITTFNYFIVNILFYKFGLCVLWFTYVSLDNVSNFGIDDTSQGSRL